jgi:hypothetical protein
MKLLFIVLFLALSGIFAFSVENKSNNPTMSPPQIQTQTHDTTSTINRISYPPNSLKNHSPNLKTPQKKPLDSIIEKKIEMPVTQINSLNTEIFISKNKCSAAIKENVVFTLSNGVFNTITRRISLDGSADSISGFKLASS